MEYPFFEVPLIGGGLLIGLIAVAHIFVSHFAVGGGLYLVLTERKAYRENDRAILGFVKTHSLFFILVTLVFGAISGVGIWFSIGLVHPTATSTLIHAFVWGWVIEWIFFFVEIAAAFIYYYSWNRVSRKTHMAFGWIYFVAAWLSLAVINGILSFMLTPGAWLETGNFWDGILNPTYFSSLLIRTAVAVILAGLYGLLTSSMIKSDERTREGLVRYNAKWLLAGFVALPFLGPVYILQIPELSRVIFMGGAAAVTLFAAATVALSALIAIFTWFGPYRSPKSFSTTMAAMLMILGFAVTGVTEWTREAVRKPFIIYDYMYSNAILVDESVAHRLDSEGVLRHAKWSSVDSAPVGDSEAVLRAGRELFRWQCQHCHTIEGYNGIAMLVYGWNAPGVEPDYTLRQIEKLNVLKPFMPPLRGTPAERRALARWLNSLNARPRPSSPGEEVNR